MTDKRLIEEIKLAVGETFESYGVNKTYKITKSDPYKRMEQLLYNYGEFENVMKEKQRQIDEILQAGLPESSKSIMEYHPTGGRIESVNIEEETVQSVVHALQEDIVWLKQALKRLDYALDTVKNESGYDILRDYYMEGYSLEKLAERYHMDRATVTKRKNKLVRKLALTMFPKDMFYELMGDAE